MTELCDAYFHESAGDPRGTGLLVGRHMTISAPVKIETNHGRGRIGRTSLNIQVLDCITIGVEWNFFAYVYLRQFISGSRCVGSGNIIIRFEWRAHFVHVIGRVLLEVEMFG